MTVVSVERIVERPPEVVFDFVARHHFENHPRWDPDLVEMSQTSRGPVGIGTTARVVRRQGRRLEATATVGAFDTDRVAAWDLRFGPFAFTSGRSSSRSGTTPRRALGCPSTPPPTDPFASSCLCFAAAFAGR